MSQFAEQLHQIDEAKKQLDALRPLDREQEERVMQKFRLWWTYHSNAIEGNKLTQGETEVFLMEGLTAKGKPLKDHLDLRGHHNAIDFLLRFIREKDVLTEAAIRHLHKILLVEPYDAPSITAEGLPTRKAISFGEYKTQSNHVITPTGETHFYATPEETPAKMHDLMDWYREQSSQGIFHPVEIAARFHHRFTNIHPFDDGNGRMSRLLMNLMLLQSGYPPVVIRLGERDLYLAALGRADTGEDEDFLTFIAEHVSSSLALYLRAANGEEIHEPTDLEKEIALLKMELRHVEEPELLTKQRQIQIFEDSLGGLFKQITKLLNPLVELFSESLVWLRGSYGTNDVTRYINESASFLEAASFPPPQGVLDGDNMIQVLSYEFCMKGFKKARFDTFDLATALEIRFESLKYQFQLQQTRPPLTIQHFYQEQLTKDEINEIAQQIARFFVEAIRQKTNGHS
jgi:Fic family protein